MHRAFPAPVVTKHLLLPDQLQVNLAGGACVCLYTYWSTGYWVHHPPTRPNKNQDPGLPLSQQPRPSDLTVYLRHCRRVPWFLIASNARSNRCCTGNSRRQVLACHPSSPWCHTGELESSVGNSIPGLYPRLMIQPGKRG